MTTKLIPSLLAAAAMASAAPRPDMVVSTDWLAKHSADPGIVILHVAANRTAYDAGHIPGARFVPLAELAVTRNGVPNELANVDDLKKAMEAAGVSDDSRIVLRHLFQTDDNFHNDSCRWCLNIPLVDLELRHEIRS